VGVVQEHVKKDIDKTAKEKRYFVKANMLPFDVTIQASRTNAANECA